MGCRRVQENRVFGIFPYIMGYDGLNMGFRWVNYGFYVDYTETLVFGPIIPKEFDKNRMRRKPHSIKVRIREY